MRIEEDHGEIAMKDVVVREADLEVGADHQADVARNVGEDREVETVDVGEAETDMIGEVRNIEDNIVVRGGLILISDLWYNMLGNWE
jgi:hypothetical protein